MKKLVVLSGSGISAESGLKTFRDTGGLWENYDVMEVASIEGWEKNKELVLRFYNDRRKQLKNAKPNAAHYGFVELEENFDVQIITQNVDNLHEQAGSKNVLHLHGELTKVRSLGDESLIYDIGFKEINLGDKCEKGFQLRPHIVWFGEPVPAIEDAAVICNEADILVIIGTSMNVYPAAGLINYVPRNAKIFVIDPNQPYMNLTGNIEFIQKKASVGIELLKNKLNKL